MRKATSSGSEKAGGIKKRAAPEPRAKLLAKRDAWLREIDPAHLFHRLFDVIPGVHFFAKNREGELMFISRNSLALDPKADEAAVIGLTDFDLNPTDVARSYVRDDARIYATGRPLLNHVELWFDTLGMPDWSVVNKMPIWSRAGEIIGIMGFSQNYDGRAKTLQPLQGIAKVVSHIRQHYHRALALGELARVAALSPRQLQRKFKAAFGVGPQQFLIKTRLLAGCHALRESGQTMAEIAYGCGFSDQSAFARHFRLHIGMTPSQFRSKEVAA